MMDFLTNALVGDNGAEPCLGRDLQVKFSGPSWLHSAILRNV